MQAAPANDKSPAAAVAAEPLMDEATHKAYNKRCSKCHSPDGRGMAALEVPDMRIAPKRSAEDWAKFLRDPKSVAPNTAMKPVKGITDEDIASLAEYLAQLTQNNAAPQAK